MKTTTQPTAEQIDALKEWASLYGRNWKSTLRQAWYDGNYNGFEKSNFLQQVRNAYGPSWLIRFSLKKCDAAYLSVEHVPGEPPTLCDCVKGHDGGCS